MFSHTIYVQIICHGSLQPFSSLFEISGKIPVLIQLFHKYCVRNIIREIHILYRLIYAGLAKERNQISTKIEFFLNPRKMVSTKNNESTEVTRNKHD